MYDGPIREGSRGGRDQFSWESVKGDKDREFYLGHSVKALVGHWQKNKDPYWYARGKDNYKTALEDEVKAIKQKEEELMLEALGLKTKTQKQTTDFGKKLQKYEVDELLKRREKEDGEEEDVEDLGPRGLGFRRTATTLATAATHEVLEGVGISDKRSQRKALPPDKTAQLQSDKDAEHRRRKKKKKTKEEKKHRRESAKHKRHRSRSPRSSRHRSKHDF